MDYAEVFDDECAGFEIPGCEEAGLTVGGMRGVFDVGDFHQMTGPVWCIWGDGDCIFRSDS